MVLDLVELILWIYFLYVVAYSFIFALAGHFYHMPRKVRLPSAKFAVFIPAYKEDAVILDVARQALIQNYPNDLYRVIIIADSLQPATITSLRSMPVEVIPVAFPSSTKVKSLTYAVNKIDAQFDYAVILDADNVMDQEFLSILNDVHATGPKAIQGQRMPKNINTNMAFLDGLSEAINNHIYRQGTSALGLSSSISGSGVSLDFSTYKELISSMTSIGGFDRELELLLLMRGIRVNYCKHAMVFDEKVQGTAVFENQRRRWISSQYHYLRKYFLKGCGSLLRGNFSFFNSAVLRNIQLPRLINLGLLATFTIAFYFVRGQMLFGYSKWPILLGLLLLSIAISIPRAFYGKSMLNSIIMVPGLFLRMFLLLFKLSGANRKFIHTPHGGTTENSNK